MIYKLLKSIYNFRYFIIGLIIEYHLGGFNMTRMFLYLFI